MRVGKVVREDAAAGIERDDTERMKELDCDNLDLQRVSGLRALDEDRSGHRMRARATFGHPKLDGLQRLRNLRLARSCQT